MLFGMSSYRARFCQLPNSDGTISSANRIKVCGTKVWCPKTHRPNNDCSALLTAFKICWVSASSVGSSWFFLFRVACWKKFEIAYFNYWRFVGNFVIFLFNILLHIQQDATLHSLFYLETALHVSGGITIHHQERKHLYLQYLVFVTPLLLPAAIVEVLELVSVCCR
jgi:hypothetical protein